MLRDKLGDQMPVDVIEYRCPSLLHGKRAINTELLEVKCRRRQCGVRPGVVVLHTFNVVTGELVKTRRFSDPVKGKEQIEHASHDAPTAVRAP